MMLLLLLSTDRHARTGRLHDWAERSHRAAEAHVGLAQRSGWFRVALRSHGDQNESRKGARRRRLRRRPQRSSGHTPQGLQQRILQRLPEAYRRAQGRLGRRPSAGTQLVRSVACGAPSLQEQQRVRRLGLQVQLEARHLRQHGQESARAQSL